MTTTTAVKPTTKPAPIDCGPVEIIGDSPLVNPNNTGTAAVVPPATVPTTPTSLPSKRDSQDDAWSTRTNAAASKSANSVLGGGGSYINPFVHTLHIDNGVEMAKIYILTVLLVPIRVMGCVLSLVTAWMLSYIGTYGMTFDDIRAKPISGWRKHVQTVAAILMRMLYASGSFHHISIKGKKASSKEAPILVVAPHSSYIDSIVVVAAGPPAIVAKKETSQIPLLGKIINYAQPIYVQREDPNSRQNTIKEIKDRAHSKENWPQVVIFAEGTCTNRKALIKFKPGAFYPGVPVQPVLLRYPNKYDTFTWTWDGPGVLRLLWLTMAQFYSRCEIEYLPVYNPSDAEQQDANLYARNVRRVMAKALDVPTSEYSFEDVIVMNRAKEMKIPFPGDIIEIENTLHKLGLLDSENHLGLIRNFLNIPNTSDMEIEQFAKLIQIDLNRPELEHLFELLDHHGTSTISLKSYLLCCLFCQLKNGEVINFLKAIVNIYADSSQRIARKSFNKILRHCGKLTEDKCNALFVSIDKDHKGVISFDDFEAHTKDKKEYKFLYKKQEHIRKTFKALVTETATTTK